MNPSKGPRREVKLRLPVPLIEKLEAERDRRHAEGTMRAVDGLPALVEEAVALRHDRDAEMDRIRAHAIDLEAQRDAARLVSREKDRELRRLRGQLKAIGARRAARAQVPLPQEPSIDAVPSKVRCGACGGSRTALDDAVGNPDCAACRARRMPSTGSHGGPPGPAS